MPMKHSEPSPTKRRDASARFDELPDVLQFMQLLWAVVHGLERTSKRMTADLGVTGPQRLVLRVVGLFPGTSAGDLAAILHVHPSTLTGILKRLTEQGLLLRVPDSQDRRRAILRLSNSGHRVNAVSRGTVEQAVRETIQGVSERDRAATRRVLDRLARKLEPRQSAVAARRYSVQTSRRSPVVRVSSSTRQGP